MIVYYNVFGVISVLALSANLMLAGGAVVHAAGYADAAGIAAIALTLGMAIDSTF